MKKMKKIVSLIFLLVALCGCLKVDVNYSIDEKYNVKLVYDIQMDIDRETIDSDTEKDIKKIFRDISKEYEKQGFIVSGELNEAINFTLTLEKKASNYEEAYAILQDMVLDSNISFFLVADISTEVEAYEQVYNFYFETDLSRIVKATQLHELPPSIRNQLYEGMEASEISLSLSLPKINIVEMSDGIEVIESKKETKFKMPIDWEEPSIMKLVLRMSLDNNKMLPYSIDESIQKTNDQINLYNALFFGGIGGAGITLGVLAYITIKNKKEKQ